MEIKHSAPRSLGVEKLVYIGDDAIPSSGPSPAKHQLLGAATIGLALVAVFGKKPATRGAAVIGAAISGLAYMGYSA